MGYLHYGKWDFPMADRELAHLQLVIGLKLRRSESFFLSWANEREQGSGRNAIWIDNGVPIFCQFDGGRMPSINREWVETLAMSANTSYGLQITPEGGIENNPSGRFTSDLARPRWRNRQDGLSWRSWQPVGIWSTATRKGAPI
jgi:hypothetical protein